MPGAYRIRRHVRGACAALLGLLLMGPVLAAGQAARAAGPTPTSPPATAATSIPTSLTATLPLDPTIKTGRLPNGLTYFIRKNGRPAQRASFRLAVKAGSIDETDRERGLAHFLEHMGFNGGSYFKPGELIKYLESIGASFGPDINAYTSFDETVYMLEVPTDREGFVDRGLQAMFDFAGGMTLSQAEVDRERGVVIEEWRQRRGAGARIQEKQAPALYGASKYAVRQPIGDPEIIKTASAADLRRFYEKWYRADRMALIAVGDVDVAALERDLVARFSALKKPTTPPPARVYPIPPHAEPRYSVVTDGELQQSSVTVIEKRPEQPQHRVMDYRRSLVENLAFQMLNARFAEIARRPNAPFLGASAGQSSVGQSVDASVLSARVKDGQMAEGLGAVVEEALRASQHGFTAGELARAQKRLLASYERMFNERNTSESAGLANELVRHVLEGEAVPGIEGEHVLATRFVPSISLAETSAVAKRLLSGRSRVVLATMPEKPGVVVPAAADLRATVQRVSPASLSAWNDEAGSEELMPVKPQPGTVASTKVLSDVGVTVLTLSNGVQVYLKPTDFKNDQVVFTAYAKGGLSLAPPEDYRDADLSTDFVDVAGVAGLTPVQLEKLLAGQTVGVSPYISAYTHGLSGSSSSKDIETALQLANLHVTKPNWTAEGFELLKTRLRAAVANRASSPGAAFGEKLQAVNTSGHYSAKPLELADVDRLRADTMKRFYEARFANAADFTYFFTGSFTVESLTPLLVRYLGSLPSSGASSATFGPMRLEFPKASAKEAVRKGQEPKAQTVLSFFADTGLDEMEMHRLRAAASVLEIRLTDIIREEMGGTYGVNVGYSDTQPVPGYGVVQVSFGSAPDTVETLVAAVTKEIARLKSEGPSADDLQKVKEIERRTLETSAKNNGYWVSSMQTVHALGWEIGSIARRLQRTESLSTENVGAAFKKYFPDTRVTQVSLLPAQP